MERDFRFLKPESVGGGALAVVAPLIGECLWLLLAFLLTIGNELLARKGFGGLKVVLVPGIAGGIW